MQLVSDKIGASATADAEKAAQEAADSVVVEEPKISPERQKQLDYLQKNNPEEYAVQIEEDKKAEAAKVEEAKEAAKVATKERVAKIQGDMDSKMSDEPK